MEIVGPPCENRSAMLKHLDPSPRRPARVVILGARGFLSTHLQDWCARQKLACLAVSSKEADLTRPEGAARLAELVQPSDAVVMTASREPHQGRDYRALMANLRMAETVANAFETAR